MATSYPLPTLAAVISATGITAPDYSDILASLKASFQLIYGADAYLEADSQDGQLLAIFARAIHDCNQTAIAAYLSYSPATSQGVALSNNVKINHLARLLASNSQVNVLVAGVAGTIITAGIVADTAGNRWNLPPEVVIGAGGDVLVTATAQQPGAIQASIGTVTSIVNPQLGWQSVTNPSAASAGAAVESDAELRVRQATSTALRSRTILDGLTGELLALQGVSYAVVYENDTGVTNADGIPPHSIAAVVQGGDSQQIGEIIFAKKTPGCGTHGTTTVSVLNSIGTLQDINYFVPTPVPIAVEVRITVNSFYTSAIGEQIKRAMVDYVAALKVGVDIEVTRLYIPALLTGDVNSTTYSLLSVKAAIKPDAVDVTTLEIPFTSKATLVVADVAVVLV